MKFESSLFTWLLPLGLLVVERLAVCFVSSVNYYRREKRAKRLAGVQALLGDPWPAEPRVLGGIDQFIDEVCKALRPEQRKQRAAMLDAKARGETCGS